MIVLGIESTCDETAASVVKDGKIILSNIIASQIAIHKQYGGVFPEMASRFHIDRMIPIIDEAMKKANVTKNDIDIIAVANTPGLIGSLLVGVNVAKSLAYAWQKPIIGINHIEAHLYAAMMAQDELFFPSIGVVLSGGHTQIIEIKDIGQYKRLGTTIDDAIGEAFDKVAQILDLPYPGGPEIEKMAKEGNHLAYAFNPGKVKNNKLDFSFSGLKTKVLYTVKGQKSNKNFPTKIDESKKPDIAASFQHTAFSDVIEKTYMASKESNAKAIYLGGGVTNNKKLRKMFNDKCFSIPICFPSFEMSLDNAAMIAGLAFHKINDSSIDLLNLDASPRASLSQ